MKTDERKNKRNKRKFDDAVSALDGTDIDILDHDSSLSALCFESAGTDQKEMPAGTPSDQRSAGWNTIGPEKKCQPEHHRGAPSRNAVNTIRGTPSMRPRPCQAHGSSFGCGRCEAGTFSPNG